MRRDTGAFFDPQLTPLGAFLKPGSRFLPVGDKRQPVRLNLSYQNREVRCVGTDERPEWIAADVGAVLGLKNVRKSMVDFTEDEKGVTTGDTLGGSQEVATVTEPGLYRLIAKSITTRG